ncbi:MAG: 1-aminocyclopropane-1-carboxylate deaminase/D-cysteine desulfhydrase [Runella sp.]
MNKIAQFWENTAQTPLQIVDLPIFVEKDIKVYIKRDDMLHPWVSGNKWRKLKYNFIEAYQQGYDTLLTFGGAYSNHVAAVAAAAQATGFESIGIIRGDELSPTSNPTLRFATDCGMQLFFVSREDYRCKEVLAEKYGSNAYILPEGGTNSLAVKGVGEVVAEATSQLGYAPHYWCTPVGTGGTFAGLCSKAEASSKVLGFVVLKNGQYLLKTILPLVGTYQNYELFWESHFGGYGKTTTALMEFIEYFEHTTGIAIEQVYTAKMLFQIDELVRQGDYFKRGDTVVVIHTGGLQGKRK